MAYNYEYPYTDVHRHNDDWLINRVKELSLEWIETRKEWNNTREEFASLKAFIQNYFAQLDVQDEVNVKLDIMARDGSLSALISPLFSEYKKEIDYSMSEQNRNISILEARMDNFTALSEGSTTGDAELIDGRVDYKGNTHSNIGEHIREVSSQLSSEIADYQNTTILRKSKNEFNPNSPDYKAGYTLVLNGNISEEDGYIVSNYFELNSGESCTFSVGDNKSLLQPNRINFYNINKEVIDTDTYKSTVIAPQGCEYCRVSAKLTSPINQKFMIAKGDIPLDYEPFYEPYIEPNDFQAILNNEHSISFDDFVGICTPTYANEMGVAIRDIGIKNIRVPLFWWDVEQEKGVYTWDKYDAIVSSCEANQLNIMFILHSGNPVAFYGDTNSIITNAQLTAFKNFVKSASKRYANKYIKYEIWNEPDVNWEGTVNEFYLMIDNITEEIKANDVTATVISLGGCGNTVKADEFLRSGLLSRADNISIHRYIGRNVSPETNYLKNILKYIQSVDSLSERKIGIYVTETGISTVPNWNKKGNSSINSEENRSKYLPRAILTSIEAGMQGVYLFRAVSSQTDETDVEHWFGILNSDYSGTLTSEALKTMMNELSGYYYIGSTLFDNRVHILRFRNKNGNIKYAYWSEKNNYKIKIGDLVLDASDIVRYRSVENHNEIVKQTIYEQKNSPCPSLRYDNCYIFNDTDVANNDNQIIIGKYSNPNVDDLFVLGNGDNGDSRKNAFSVRHDSIVVGDTVLSESAIIKLLELIN